MCCNYTKSIDDNDGDHVLIFLHDDADHDDVDDDGDYCNDGGGDDGGGATLLARSTPHQLVHQAVSRFSPKRVAGA